MENYGWQLLPLRLELRQGKGENVGSTCMTVRRGAGSAKQS